VSLVWIASQSVGAGGASSVTFSSIPSTFTHLQIRVSARTGAGYESDGCNIRFNNDSTNSYVVHFLQGDSVNASSSNATAQQSLYIAGRLPGSTVTASVFGSVVADILDYTNTSKNKTVRSISGFDTNNTSAVVRVAMMSGLWVNTSAISQIEILANNGGFVQYSRFDLYGITSSQVTGA
jgi:hypothetical protein